MKIMVCPLNGPRPVSEFAYGGEVRQSPDPDTCSDAEWSGYVFNRPARRATNTSGGATSPPVSGSSRCATRPRDMVIATYPAETARQRLCRTGARHDVPTRSQPENGSTDRPS